MLTLEINKNEVERARLVKEANFPCFCVRQNSTSLIPICQNFAEFELAPNKVAWIPQASFKVWFISMFGLSIE